VGEGADSGSSIIRGNTTLGDAELAQVLDWLGVGQDELQRTMACDSNVTIDDVVSTLSSTHGWPPLQARLIVARRNLLHWRPRLAVGRLLILGF